MVLQCFYNAVNSYFNFVVVEEYKKSMKVECVKKSYESLKLRFSNKNGCAVHEKCIQMLKHPKI